MADGDNGTLLNLGSGGDTIAGEEQTGKKWLYSLLGQLNPAGAWAAVSELNPFWTRESHPAITGDRRYFDTVYDGSGSIIMAADFSTVADKFGYQTQGSDIHVKAIHLIMLDNDHFDHDDFAAITGGVATGFSFAHRNGDDTLVQILHPVPLTSNQIIYGQADHLDKFEEGSGLLDHYMRACWHFDKGELILINSTSDKLEIELVDDYSTMDHLYVFAVGYTVN